MLVATLALTTALVLVFPMVCLVRHGWLNTPSPNAGPGDPLFRRWTAKSLVVPLLLWCGWNSLALLGPARGWIPLLPWSGGDPVVAFLGGTGWGLFWAVLVWGAFTLAWLFPRMIRSIRHHDEFAALAWLVGGVSALLLAGAVVLRSWGLALLISAGGLAVLFHWSIPLIHRPRPSYTRAIGRIKRGHYAEAEEEVIRQLEEKADDYDGWMMLAELYAERFDQLNEAEQTVRELCDQPGWSPFDIARAFTRLAQWQIDQGNNPAAARAALSEILRRCPGTPFARTAEHRLRQLPVDEADLAERRQPRMIRLNALCEEDGGVTSEVGRLAAQIEAGTLRKRLEGNPTDGSTRLRLARLLAERLGQIEAARIQLRLLRESPEAAPGRHAEALAAEASWELRLLHRETPARHLLSRLLRDHPGTPQAWAARRQLEILDHPKTHRNDPLPPPPPRRIVIRIPPPEPS